MIFVEHIKIFYKRFYSAVTLLTVLPLPGWELDFKNTTHYFPWVGIILSLVYLTVYTGLEGSISPLMLAFVIVILDGFLTGGLHLDGFSDWVDGIYSRKEGEDLRAVLKDSNIGAIGAAGLVFLILGKTFFLREVLVGEYSAVWIVFFPWFARFFMYLIIILFPYPKGKSGLGEICQEKYYVYGYIFAFASFLALLVLIYFVTPAYFIIRYFYFLTVAVIIAGVMTYIFIKRLAVKLGGVNGDGYGASCEFCQLMVLFIGGIMA